MRLGIATLVAVMSGMIYLDSSAVRAENMTVKCPGTKTGIKFYRQATWHLQDKLNLNRTKASATKFHSCKYGVWVAHLWHRRSHRLFVTLKKVQAQQRRFQSAGALTSDWACIHSYEGAWNADTGNGYYGGLQMDYGFMQSYGPEFLARWGTANNWPVYAQIIAANRAKAVRGYSPWPNTAAMCGL